MFIVVSFDVCMSIVCVPIVLFLPVTVYFIQYAPDTVSVPGVSVTALFALQ